jgi:hypothetical protein
MWSRTGFDARRGTTFPLGKVTTVVYNPPITERERNMPESEILEIALHVILDEYEPNFDYLDDVDALVERRGYITAQRVA